MRTAGKLADLSMALTGRFTGHHALLCRLHLDRITVLQRRRRRPGRPDRGQGRALAARGRPAEVRPRVRRRGDLCLAGRDRPRPAQVVLPPREARLLGDLVPGEQHQRPQAQARPDRRCRDLHQADADPGRLVRDPGPGRLQARYNRLVRRFGGQKNPAAKKKAITAIAHTLLKIAYQVLKSGTPYQDLGADFYTRRELSRAAPDSTWNASCKSSTPAARSPSPSAPRRPPYHPALNRKP